MGALVSIGLVIVGAALTALGFVRARAPWGRYQALKAEDANIARYESWRGGLRDSGTTGASVAMDVLRRQARDGALIAIVGIVLAVVGISLR
ncbi:MAG TPA: hypothetical protein VKC59_06825 [Candidatus Limnocylindrales bacterium]|nr:hypothetical protein [Candidatus Limnocylindrales bacterium]